MVTTMIILGHRGARFEAPENTVPGFQHAVDLGLKAVEFDVRMSKDGHLVIMHDATVDRTTNGEGEVASKTLDELQALDARSIFPGWPDPATVPTFGEVLDVVKGVDVIQVEIKSDTPARLDVIVPKTIAKILDRKMEHQVAIISFDPYAIEIAQRLAPQIVRGYIGAWDTPEFLQKARELECIDACTQHLTSDRELVAEAKSLGFRVTAWPTNSAEDLESALTLNPDLICTDSPSLITNLLAEQELPVGAS